MQLSFAEEYAERRTTLRHREADGTLRIRAVWVDRVYLPDQPQNTPDVRWPEYTDIFDTGDDTVILQGRSTVFALNDLTVLPHAMREVNEMKAVLRW